MREIMPTTHHQAKLLFIQWPAVETLPSIAQRAGNGEFRISRLERTDDLRSIASEEFELESGESAHQFGERRDEQLQADAVGERQPKRCLNTLLDRSSKVAGCNRAFIAARKQWHHLVTKIGEVGVGPFAAEQWAPQFLLKLFDSLAQRWLCDVTDLGRMGEVQGLGHGQEIADLMHFHAAVGSLLQRKIYLPA